MTLAELKNTIGLSKTVQMVGKSINLPYYPETDDTYECCRNIANKDSVNYVEFWYNPEIGFRLKFNNSVFPVDYVEFDEIVEFVLSFYKFAKSISSQTKLQNIEKDFK